jgi:hypothetical protein
MAIEVVLVEPPPSVVRFGREAVRRWIGDELQARGITVEPKILDRAVVQAARLFREDPRRARCEVLVEGERVESIPAPNEQRRVVDGGVTSSTIAQPDPAERMRCPSR